MSEGEKISCHNNNFHEKLLEVKNWSIPPKQIKNIQSFFRDYELGKITGRRGASPEGNLLRNLYHLKVGLENIKGESVKEIEQFLEDLLRDKIKRPDNNPYVLKSKKAILKILVAFYKWKKKDNLANILNLDMSVKKNDIETLSEDEVKSLLETTKSPDKQYLIAVLNSSGMRAEEFHNIRFQDVLIPTKENNKEFVTITIKNQYSKTLGRTIALYDKNVTPIIKKYISIRIGEGIKPNEPVFPLGYNGCRKWLNRIGKKTINKNVHYHLFRHTTATRLASKMNRQQLCVYFGWKFSSPMPDIYIQRAGVNMDDVENKFKSTMFEEMQDEIESLKQQNNEQQKIIDGLLETQEDQGKMFEDSIKQFQNKINDILSKKTE